jgi:Tol biopolymer transport system component
MSQDTTPEEGQLVLGIKEPQSIVAPEGKVDIHIGVVNKGANEDYVDIQINGVPSEWITLDNPVVHLGSNEAKQVTLTIQPPPTPQSRAGQYPLDVRAVSQSDPRRSAVARSTLIVAAYQSEGRIGIILSSIYFSVGPGSSVTIPVLLQNLGLKEDTFQLNIEGIPANWITSNALFTKLEPSSSKEIEFTIHVPRSPEAGVGRTPFKIILISQDYPDQKTEADCILTIAAFSKFSATLQPTSLPAGQPGQLSINNEGNTLDTYSLSFRNPAGALVFEKEVPVSRSGSQLIETAYFDIPQDEKIQVEPGGQGTYTFRSRVVPRPIFGKDRAYPFTINVLSTENTSVDLQGETHQKGLIRPWWLAALVIGSLLLCLLVTVPLYNLQVSASITQTAVSVEQTQAALAGSGQEDTDGDGLSNSDELKLGTDPLNPDTDGDGLTDGQEANILRTNPLVADTDQDGLPDGQEVQIYKTNPLNPDTDGDLLSDGDEVNRKTDPLNPDTDKDGLNDGVEISIGTDPLQPDTDKDGLLDGQENQTCPRPLVPDSDGDGILDGRDLDPCNPNNPALTATAITTALTQSPQATALPPTQTPQATVLPPPTNNPTSTPTPTSTVIAAITPPVNLPALQGIMLFASNRDGNPEIYAENLSNQSLLRLTNNQAVDMQPAIAPDGLRIAYVSNQNGNNEIYLGGIDRRPSVNLTNNPGDDQQPIWSPDGNWIAFTSNRDGNQEIYVMRSTDGSQVHNLTSNPASDFAPTWFSVSRFLGISTENWIVFTSNRDGNQEIYKVNPDGTGLTNLTKNPANDYSPTSFPEGGLLAFVSDRDGNPEIYTMTTDGGSPANISNNAAQDLDPTFDPSGRWVAYSSDRDGNLDIYLVEVTGGTTYNLTRNPAQDVSPDW